jgi:hypothetical protein
MCEDGLKKFIKIVKTEDSKMVARGRKQKVSFL